MDIESGIKLVSLALVLAFLSESLVEYLFGTAVDHLPSLAGWRWSLMYIAAVVGVTLSFYYGIDLIALLADRQPTSVGFLLSGLVVGRGANYMHQFVSNYFPRDPARVTVSVEKSSAGQTVTVEHEADV